MRDENEIVKAASGIKLYETDRKDAIFGTVLGLWLSTAREGTREY
jgi:hypothetical protein